MSSTTLATRRAIRAIAVIAMLLSSHRPPLRPYLHHRRKAPGAGSYECPNSCPVPALDRVARGAGQPRGDHTPSRCVISVRSRRGAHPRSASPWLCDCQLVTARGDCPVVVAWCWVSGATFSSPERAGARRGDGPCSSDGVLGPVRWVGAEQPQMVPEQAGRVDAGVGTELLDVEPEPVSVSAAQLLVGEAANGHPLQDHPVAVDDLTGVLAGRVVRGAGTVARGGVDLDVGSVGPDAQVADVRVEPGAAGGQHELVCAQQPGIGFVVRVVDPPLAGQAGELGWEHEWCGRVIPDMPGDFERLALHVLVVPQR